MASTSIETKNPMPGLPFVTASEVEKRALEEAWRNVDYRMCPHPNCDRLWSPNNKKPRMMKLFEHWFATHMRPDLCLRFACIQGCERQYKYKRDLKRHLIHGHHFGKEKARVIADGKNKQWLRKVTLSNCFEDEHSSDSVSSSLSDQDSDGNFLDKITIGMKRALRSYNSLDSESESSPAKSFKTATSRNLAQCYVKVVKMPDEILYCDARHAESECESECSFYDCQSGAEQTSGDKSYDASDDTERDDVEDSGNGDSKNRDRGENNQSRTGSHIEHTLDISSNDNDSASDIFSYLPLKNPDMSQGDSLKDSISSEAVEDLNDVVEDSFLNVEVDTDDNDWVDDMACGDGIDRKKKDSMKEMLRQMREENNFQDSTDRSVSMVRNILAQLKVERRKVEKLTMEKNRIHFEKCGLETENKQLKEQNDKYKEDQVKLEEEVELLREEVDSMNTEASKFEGQNKRLEIENEKLRVDLEKKGRENDQLKDMVANLLDDLDNVSVTVRVGRKQGSADLKL